MDGGASHNFVSLHVATVLELPLEQNQTMGVKLGGGHWVNTTGKSRGSEV